MITKEIKPKRNSMKMNYLLKKKVKNKLQKRIFTSVLTFLSKYFFFYFFIISETFLNLLSSYGNHNFRHASFSPLILTDHQDLSHFGFTNNNTISVFYPSYNNFVSILYLSFIIIVFFMVFFLSQVQLSLH